MDKNYGVVRVATSNVKLFQKTMQGVLREFNYIY